MTLIIYTKCSNNNTIPKAVTLMSNTGVGSGGGGGVGTRVACAPYFFYWGQWYVCAAPPPPPHTHTFNPTFSFSTWIIG